MKKLLVFIAVIAFKFSVGQWTGTPHIYNTNTGNVGIGTTTPGNPLTVIGTNNVESPTIPRVLAVGDPSAPTKTISLGYNTSLDAGVLAAAHAFIGWKNILINPNGGKVGIGTSNPKTLLDIGGEIRMGQINSFPSEGSIGEGDWGNYIIGDVSSSQQLRLGVSNDLFTRAEIFLDNGNRQDGTISFKTASGAGGANTSMFINGDGNVGIGMTTPVAKLQVAGDIRQSGRTTYLFGANANENQALMFSGWGAAHGGIYWRGDSKTFTINTGDNADNAGRYGNANLVVTGNVGIGASNTQGYKLAVNGDAIFTKVKVKQYGSWPDYVFHPSYKLPALKELEDYIKRYQHLPEVPSAKEVEQNGLDLGDNQAMLLKKIEELTLYIIGQDKKIESQQNQIQQLLDIKQELAAIKAKLQNND